MATAYRRVNVDGKSITETRVAAASLNPGSVVEIDSDNKFAQATTPFTGKRLYVLNPAYHQGLDIATAIPAGDSAVGDYLEDNRELAVRVAAGTYTKDQPMTIVGGVFAAVPATAGTYPIFGYSQDDATFAAADFLRVRIQTGDTVTKS